MAKTNCGFEKAKNSTWQILRKWKEIIVSLQI